MFLNNEAIIVKLLLFRKKVLINGIVVKSIELILSLALEAMSRCREMS